MKTDSGRMIEDVTPNAEGLFTFAGIKALAKRRGCKAIAAKPTLCKIRGSFTTTNLVFDQPGLCGPHRIFTACTIAIGRRPIAQRRCEPPAGLDTSWHGLFESALAELLGADGIEPYRAGRRTIAFESLLRSKIAGGVIDFAGENRHVKAAVRCVVDAGFADVALGPRGGWQQTRLTWCERARPQLSEIESEALSRLL
jgi:hypothetical protein